MWMIETASPYSPQIFAVGLVLFGAIVNRLFRLKPKLLYSVGHSSAVGIAVPPPASDASPGRALMRSASIFIGNGGLQPAKRVEATFAFRPAAYHVHPMRSFQEEVGAAGTFSLRFDSLAPSEQVRIEIVSFNQELPLITAVRSDECTGRLVEMMVQRVWPNWITRTLVTATLLGIATSVYLVFEIIGWVARQ